MPPNRNRNRKGKGSTTPYARLDTTTVKQEEVTPSETYSLPTSTQTALPGPSGVMNQLASNVGDALSYFRRQLNPEVVQLAAQSRVEDKPPTAVHGGPVQQQLPPTPVATSHWEKKIHELKEKIKTMEKRNEGLRLNVKQMQTHHDRLKQNVCEEELKHQRLSVENEQLRKDKQKLFTRAQWLQDRQSDAGIHAKAEKELAEKIRQKDEQLHRYGQFLCGGGLSGWSSGLAITAIPPELLSIYIQNLPGENLDAQLSPFSNQVMIEMNEAYHITFGQHSSSPEISAHLLKALEQFYPVIEIFKDRGIQKQEEEPLRHAYTMYDKAINCSHSPKGWQFGQSSRIFGSQVFDTLKLLRWDSMLAETITKGIELGWKVTRAELAEDLEVIKTVRLDAMTTGMEWYPQTVAAMEKAISAS